LESTNSVDSAVQNAVEAVEAVNNLFTDNTYTTLSPNTTTETIKEARTLILKAVGKCDIVHLSNLCKKAESLLALSVHL
ncbi:toxin Cry1Ac domain D-VI-related protein, partial [Enterococcus hirae]|uniref:toxin Cry1Ac domain D-VI-related protein n=1 Tax=Enterococcus hirae TaxID=1354 RepID=UPI003392FA33